ncbi:MAG: MBL fold metallo-hydrolase [Methylovulum sp.]|uniref:MBL fold metallo-hydrolase n=1 Tax=Methylovulum sp. TaxID=1916980 RepID=UPI00260A0EED|nr:MBL fold metallo-hydrolase [Methylovulum sp.]MDD2725483.1 MBL fold metallo-hydrolase [Methylovulum sp.]MDD5125671.1 MBL fold metallo-hydrolase [Methylovulum sp.]
MKLSHRKDLFAWSVFNEERDLDFHSYLWVREGGNVVIDPLPLSAHDHKHLQKLGGVDFIVITNSDHCRATEQLAGQTGAAVYGPSAEQETFPVICDRWLYDGEEIVPGLLAYQLNGSKTPGELALLLEHTTLITGDLIRCHQAGELCMLPDAKLADRKLAIQSVKRIASFPGIHAVLTGDGWPLFVHGGEALHHLARSL